MGSEMRTDQPGVRGHRRSKALYGLPMQSHHFGDSNGF